MGPWPAVVIINTIIRRNLRWTTAFYSTPWWIEKFLSRIVLCIRQQMFIRPKCRADLKAHSHNMHLPQVAAVEGYGAKIRKIPISAAMQLSATRGKCTPCEWALIHDYFSLLKHQLAKVGPYCIFNLHIRNEISLN